MKFICTLPESNCYSPLQSNTEGRYIWQDKNTPLLRITAPTPAPWKQKLIVLPSVQKSKSDTYVFPTRLNLRCFLIGTAADEEGDAIEGKIYREHMRGQFTYSQNSPVLFFSFPIAQETVHARNPQRQWILYSFYRD